METVWNHFCFSNEEETGERAHACDFQEEDTFKDAKFLQMIDLEFQS